MRYGRIKRSRNSVMRAKTKQNYSVSVLRIIKAVVAVLIVLTVALAIVFASPMFKNGKLPFSQSDNSDITTQDNNELLLRVVNRSNPLDEDYVPELAKHDTYSVSVYADEALNALLSAAESENVSLSVQSAYISYKEQKKLYNNKFKSFLKDKNLSEVRAQAQTEAIVPQAGNSEAQTGLLVKFKTNGKFSGSKASRWLKDNCVEYGFVLRYPSDKTSQTSMKSSETLYRYVGRENAEIMRSLNKSLDEYYVYINSR